MTDIMRLHVVMFLFVFLPSALQDSLFDAQANASAACLSFSLCWFVVWGRVLPLIVGGCCLAHVGCLAYRRHHRVGPSLPISFGEG